MRRHIWAALPLACTLVLSIMNSLFVQSVSAEEEGIRIKLPFSTSWELEPGQAFGKDNSVDSYNDFSSPELRDVKNEVQPPSPEIFGFYFGDCQLKAAGCFDSPNSYCYFNRFDMTPECDYRLPFKIREHTGISIFYYHSYDTCQCMIDAQLYDIMTDQYWTLRDFNYDGKYIVDQNGVRIHPAH